MAIQDKVGVSHTYRTIRKQIRRLILKSFGLFIRFTRFLRSKIKVFAITYLGAEYVPFTPEYRIHKSKYILNTLNNTTLMEKFAHNETLPLNYGYALDERCVEFPWILSRIKQDEVYILDAGSALNHDSIVHFFQQNSAWQRKKLHTLTLAPEGASFWKSGISYIYDDLRSLPFRDGLYDAVICLSTLEHVGFDNSVYTRQDAHLEHHKDDYIKVMREFHRVLRPGGSLLLSVPFGFYEDLGTCQIFNEALLDKAIDAFGGITEEKVFFRYTQTGWQLADASSCSSARYVNWIMTPSSKRPKQFPIQPDRAVAARALACVIIKKRDDETH